MKTKTERAKCVVKYLAEPFCEEPSIFRARAHIADVAAGRSFNWTIRFVDISPVKPLAENAPVSHTFSTTGRALEGNGRRINSILSDSSRQIHYEKNFTIYTFPHSEVCHLVQLPKLQLRTLASDGAAFRQAVSLTLIVNMAAISCLQVKSRVWIPTPHVALHGVHSPNTHLPWRKKIQLQS